MVNSGGKTVSQTEALAVSNKWSKYMIDTYQEKRVPLLSTVSVKGIEELAKEKMKDRMGKEVKSYSKKMGF